MFYKNMFYKTKYKNIYKVKQNIYITNRLSVLQL